MSARTCHTWAGLISEGACSCRTCALNWVSGRNVQGECLTNRPASAQSQKCFRGYPWARTSRQSLSLTDGPSLSPTVPLGSILYMRYRRSGPEIRCGTGLTSLFRLRLSSHTTTHYEFLPRGANAGQSKFRAL
jgi:hypothetical protein